jgi:glycine cleavage system H protein
LGKVFAPVSGELVAVNEALETNPGLINEDCYNQGWMYKIKPDAMEDLQHLIHGPSAVETWLLAEIEKYAKDAAD